MCQYIHFSRVLNTPNFDHIWSFGGKFELLYLAVSLCLFIPLRWGFHQKSYNSIQKSSIKLVTISFPNFYSDAKFGHHLWRHNSSHMAKTISFDRYGRKSPSNRPMWNEVKCFSCHSKGLPEPCSLYGVAQTTSHHPEFLRQTTTIPKTYTLIFNWLQQET